VLIVRGAELVWDGIDEVPGGVVACADGVVVEPSSDGAVELDASGCIVTPGLVNAHHHLLQTAFRTLPGTRGVPMRDWLPRMASA
jgi:8-oxoguanine deaminase